MRYQQNQERRAVILMVVVALLGLFALVGVTFVLYADAEAAAARVYREAENQANAGSGSGIGVTAEAALAFFLGQLIYDVQDNPLGALSGVRGHSLARTMYGYNSLTPTLNVTPYNGTSRLHTNGTTWPFLNPYGLDDHLLVNYTWFSGDGFARDPEWYTNGLQQTPAAAKASGTGYYVGSNAPYTYPDLNNFFLAAVRSDGTLLAPSFHRPWLFNPGKAFNDMTNPNWTNPQGKYMTPRPRPQEHPQFPPPGDAFGDVQNLVGFTKHNDSIWMDFGAPVMTARDGTKYKMLFAPLVMDLDNRINVASAGNIVGIGNTAATPSRSNQGWFPSEVNPGYLWSNAANAAAQEEWINLFLGNLASSPNIQGKYGWDKTPSGPLFSPGSLAHFYSQSDLDGRNELAGGAPTKRVLLQTTSAITNLNPCFPTFPQGYGSGSDAERITVSNGVITYRHPAAYAAYKSPLFSMTTITSVNPNIEIQNNDIVFPPSDMEALLRHSFDNSSTALVSQLLHLCPQSLGGITPDVYQRRHRITTISSALTRPGLSPWIYNPSNPALTPYYSTYAINAAQPWLPPVGNPLPFPPFADRTQAPVGSDFTANWRGIDGELQLGSAVGRIDLNRPLPPFPHMSSGTTPALVAANSRFDNAAGSVMAGNVQKGFKSAMQARQQFALDLYTRLLAVTGVAPPSNVKTPTPADLAPRRWLAQLAANIVDYIDADEISTPFNFYDPANGLGLPASPSANYQVITPPTATSGTTQVTPTTTTEPPFPGPFPAGNPNVPTYWVFGTELPRVVINEVLGEYTLPTNNQNPPTAQAGTFNVNLWVELFNPMPASAAVTGSATTNGSKLQPMDAQAVPLFMPTSGTAPLYSPYQIVIANKGEIIANNPVPIPNSQGLWYNAAGINNNVLGTPQQLRYSPAPAPANSPAICGFATGNGNVGTVANPAGPYSIGGPVGVVPPGTQTGGLLGQAYMIVGPPGNDVNNDINAANVTAAKGNPANVPWLQSPFMRYQANYNPTPPAGQAQWTITVPGQPNPVSIYDNLITNGVSVLLRRLANPHLPANPFLPTGGLTFPGMPPNPYITVDYVHNVLLNGYGSNGTQLVRASTFNPPPYPTPTWPAGAAAHGSFGKFQPYAAHNIHYGLQQRPTNPPFNNQQTLGAQNDPIANPFSWLVHLDRKLISPMELLHVSGFYPYQLTQRFIVPNTAAQVPQPYNYTPPNVYNNITGAIANPLGYNPAQMSCFQHYVPWLDQTRRLYRLFEFLETHDGASGVSPVNGRVPGKININTCWDPPATYSQIYNAIADPPGTPLNPATPDNPNFNAATVNTIFQTLLSWRTPGLAATPPVLSGVDHPFLGMAAGFSPANADPQYPPGQFTYGNGINHTLLSSYTAAGGTQPTVLNDGPALQLPNNAPTNPQVAHPYMQNELLTKIYNRLTTRSNVFAVFLTVGFFEVITDPSTGNWIPAVGQPNIPQLGPEIGAREGRPLRPRMFAIVDRTNLALMTTASTTPITPGTRTVTVATTTGTNQFTGAPWSITPETQLVIEPDTANEETVTVKGVTANSFTANFRLPHPNPLLTGLPGYVIVQRGNPGPWTLMPYEPRLDPLVVPYFSIIQQ